MKGRFMNGATWKGLCAKSVSMTFGDNLHRGISLVVAVN